MHGPPIQTSLFAAPRPVIDRRPDGIIVLRASSALAPYPGHLGQVLRRWARERPETTFLAERSGTEWRRVDYRQALVASESIGQSLLERGMGPRRPVMILSGNSVDHALLMLGAFLAGVPVAPISPAYSLMSHDYSKVRRIVELVSPGLVYAEAESPFASVLREVDFADAEIVLGRDTANCPATPFSDLLSGVPGSMLTQAEASLGPDTVAKYLFTSGSTGRPKGVINTHRMLCSNQQMIEQCWPFVVETPPRLVDWLPWNHTFGGNHNFNLVLKQGGTLHIDGGKPTPELVETTVGNLREISPTIYFNVPVGFSMLLPYLEEDSELRQSFFGDLQVIFYAGSALPQDLWTRLRRLAEETAAQPVAMASAWGSTETAPMSTTVHFPVDRSGVIGLPPPGVEIKLVPAGSKTELRVRGPNVTPGYLGQPELTEAAFDSEGYYKIGDAGRFVDDTDPSQGLAFDGRIAEDFKLLTGTWVNVGKLRVKVLAAAAPVLQDVVVCGHDRYEVGLLAWPNVRACRELSGDSDAEQVAEQPFRTSRVVDHIKEGLSRHNEEHSRSSMRVGRVLMMADPPSFDAGEITDKGYVNQRAVLERRAVMVDELYAEPAGPDVIVIP